MSCKSGLYAVNNASQTMTINGVINFGQLVRKFGQNINLSGGNVVLRGVGYYNISANFVLTANGAGPVVIQLYRNGVPIAGAVASMTTTATRVYTLSIPPVKVREFCCNEDIITAVITGDASTITTAAINVDKL